MRARTAFSFLATLFLVFGNCICPFKSTKPLIFGLEWSSSDVHAVSEIPQDPTGRTTAAAILDVGESSPNSGWYTVWVNNPFRNRMHITLFVDGKIVDFGDLGAPSTIGGDYTNVVPVLEMLNKPSRIEVRWSKDSIASSAPRHSGEGLKAGRNYWNELPTTNLRHSVTENGSMIQKLNCVYHTLLHLAPRCTYFSFISFFSFSHLLLNPILHCHSCPGAAGCWNSVILPIWGVTFLSLYFIQFPFIHDKCVVGPTFQPFVPSL